MFAWTALFAAFVGKPDVIQPSKKTPAARLLLSPPMPRMIAPLYYLGFAGGTGGKYAQTEVRDVKIVFPGPTCL